MFYPDGMNSNRCGKSLAQVLTETTEQNKALRIEVEDLRQKLRDAHGDIKVNLFRQSVIFTVAIIINCLIRREMNSNI
jgi:hypothetical protein